MLDRIAMFIKWHCAGRVFRITFRIPALPFLWRWANRRIDVGHGDFAASGRPEGASQ